MTLRAVSVSGSTVNSSQVIGTTTNDDAAAGRVGEFISSTVLVGGAVSFTTGNAGNITSISLTAGDWDVFGNVATNPGAGTIQSDLMGWIRTTSATVPTFPNNGGVFYNNFAVSADAGQAGVIGTQRISLSATTTVYLSARVGFTVSTMSLYGFIGARRAR